MHRVTAPALVLGHMNGHMHLLDDGHMDFLVDGDVLDDGHMLDDVHRHLYLFGMVMMDGVYLVRNVHDDVFTASRKTEEKKCTESC